MIVNGHEIKMYESIEDAPIVRKNLHDRYAMIDAGVGSDSDSIESHVNTVIQYFNRGMKEEAFNELLNYKQNLYFILENVSPKMMSFVPLIKSINGRPVRDLSEDGIKEVLNELSKKGLTYGMLKSELARIKKKMESEIEIFFPSIKSSKAISYYANLKKKCLLLVDQIKGEDKDELIEALETEMLRIAKPGKYGGKDGKEVKFLKGFENNCNILRQHVNKDPKTMTTLEYLQALELVINDSKKKRRKNG